MSAQVVKYQKGKTRLEILTFPGSVKKYADKLDSLKQSDLDNILASDKIYTNSKKGSVANNSQLENAFGSSDLLTCVKKMLGGGKSQTTGEERKQDLDKKTNEVLTYLNKNYIDAKTGYPHPVSRLEGAIKKIKYVVDPKKGTDSQAKEIIKKLHGVLFFKENSQTYEVIVSTEYKGVDNVFYGLGTVSSKKKEKFQTKWIVNIVPGNNDNFMKKLNAITHGDYQMKVIT